MCVHMSAWLYALMLLQGSGCRQYIRFDSLRRERAGQAGLRAQKGFAQKPSLSARNRHGSVLLGDASHLFLRLRGGGNSHHGAAPGSAENTGVAADACRAERFPLERSSGGFRFTSRPHIDPHGAAKPQDPAGVVGLREDIFERNLIAAAVDGGEHSSAMAESIGESPGSTGNEVEGPAEDANVFSQGAESDSVENSRVPRSNPDGVGGTVKDIPPITWRSMCERFPEEAKDLVGGSSSDEADSEQGGRTEAGTLSEELHEHLAAAAVDTGSTLAQVCGKFASCYGATPACEPSSPLFSRAVNKARPVTPLMAAAAAGKRECVEWLLERGACADIEGDCSVASKHASKP